MPVSREAEVKAMIRDTLRQSLAGLRGFKVVLFGSRPAGTARPRSDFDVGVLGAEPLPIEVFYRIQDRLAELRTLYRIDWVDLQRVSPEFRGTALAHTETLFEG